MKDLKDTVRVAEVAALARLITDVTCDIREDTWMIDSMLV